MENKYKDISHQHNNKKRGRERKKKYMYIYGKTNSELLSCCNMMNKCRRKSEVQYLRNKTFSSKVNVEKTYIHQLQCEINSRQKKKEKLHE